MRRDVQAAALLFATGWLALESSPAIAQLLPPPMATGVQVAYVEPANPAHRAIYERLKKREVLEHYKEFMSPLQLKTPLQVVLQGCDGKINAWYNGSAKITYCYELVAELEKCEFKSLLAEVRAEAAAAGPAPAAAHTQGELF